MRALLYHNPVISRVSDKSEETEKQFIKTDIMVDCPGRVFRQLHPKI